MSENINIQPVNTEATSSLKKLEKNFFNIRKASKSFYNSLIENPVYYEKNKGITYNIVFIHPLEFFEIISQYTSPEPCKVEELLKMLENDPNTQMVLDYYNKHKEEKNIFSLCSLDYNFTPSGKFFEYDGKHRMFVANKIFGNDVLVPVMIIRRDSVDKGFNDMTDSLSSMFIEEDLEKIKLTWEDVNNLAKKGYESKEYFDITQTFNNNYISKYFILDDGTLLQMKEDGIHTDFHFWLYHLQNLGYDIQDFPEFNNESEVKDYGYGHMWPLKWLGAIRVGNDIDSVSEDSGYFSTCAYMEFSDTCHISPAQMSKIKRYLENYLDTNNEDTYRIYLSGGEDNVNYTGLTKDLNIDHLIKQIINNISYYSHNGIFKVFGDVIGEGVTSIYGSVDYNLGESLEDEFHLPKKLAHYGLHRYFSGDAIIFARAFKDKEKAKDIVSISKNECGIPARLIPQKDKFCVYICRKGFPKGFEGWKDIEGLKEELEEKKDDHAQDAVDYFGTTDDMTIVGYLTKDGQFISLGEEGYDRGDDHRVISAVYDDDEVFDTGTDYLIDFMNEGNIRLIPEQPGIDLIKEPTQEQYSSLYKFIYYFWSHIDPRKDSFIFNVSDGQGYDIGYKEFSFFENTPTKILNGIKDYYAGNLQLNESYLTEKTRNELITKSRHGDRYKDQSLGRNRWERRNRSKIANRVDQYNKINMNSLFKEDTLKVGIHVYGETNEYIVTVRLEGVIKEIADRVKANEDKFEYKCVYMAIQSVMNSDNVYVSCSCPDWQYRMAAWATKGDYNSGAPEVRPSDITNPNDTKGAGCKHVNLVIGNIQWVLKVASIINNYVHYMEKTPQMQRLFADFIFPKIFGMPYQRAVQLSLFDIDDDLKDDEETIALSNKYGRQRNNNIGQSTRGEQR